LQAKRADMYPRYLDDVVRVVPQMLLVLISVPHAAPTSNSVKRVNLVALCNATLERVSVIAVENI